MDSSKRPDLRVQRTIKSIHDAFCDLLLEVPYEKMTVAMLCERALVNKKTFYRYYPNLAELLAVLQREIAMPYVEQTRGMRYPDDLEQVVRLFLTYSARQGTLYDHIVCNTDYAPILQTIIIEMEEDRYSVSSAPDGWNEAEWALYMEYATETQLALYRKWVLDGRAVPVERMVELACALICHGGASLPA